MSFHSRYNFTLSPGDKIGIFSPSTPATYLYQDRYHRAFKFISDKGFEVKCGSLTEKTDYYRSGSIQERANELNELIYDPDVKCIISTIGGMNSNSIIPYIDYKYLSEHPKIIVGYSDMTAILMSVYSKCSFPVFYGPAFVSTFGEYPPFCDISWNYFTQLFSNDIEFPLKLEKPKYWTEEYLKWDTQSRSKSKTQNEWITVSPGKATGRLIIGNLDAMYGIWGSEYMPQVSVGDILFIEDSLKDISEIERGYALLKCTGIFNKISAIILGKYELFDDKGSGRKPYEVLTEVLGKQQIPILADVDCSHTHPMMTLPLGANVTVDTVQQSIIINSLEDKGTRKC